MQVIHKHHPTLKIHDEIETLVLADFVPAGCRLDFVVFSTPCTDVSARGEGEAQDGQVRSLAIVYFDVGLVCS